MKIVSWQPVLTDHLSYTLAALQQHGPSALEVYVANSVHVERQAQGWVNQHAPSLSPTLIPHKGWLGFAIRRLRENRDAVHLFGSPFEQKKLIIVLFLAVALGLRVYLISEPYSAIPIGYLSDKQRLVNWLKAKSRPLLYRVYGLLLRHRVRGVFAISCRAVSQYKDIGFASEKIFPFGYFVPCLVAPDSAGISGPAPVKGGGRIVFVGNLIATKGLDVLIRAVRSVNCNQVSVALDVYGFGDSSQYDFDQTTVRYCGLLQFGTAQDTISKYDVLVLPSRYDGWGVVVNEALLAGVPVICSNQVGAGAIVEKWKCGRVFTSEDVSDLALKLKELLADPALLTNMGMAARKAGESLDPKIAGQYMFEVINHDFVDDGRQTKPECPWYECR